MLDKPVLYRITGYDQNGIPVGSVNTNDPNTDAFRRRFPSAVRVVVVAL